MSEIAGHSQTVHHVGSARARRRAVLPMPTSRRVPSVAQIVVHSAIADHCSGDHARQEANVPLATREKLPPAATISGGHQGSAGPVTRAPGGEGQVENDGHIGLALSDICAALTALQRKRRFCIVSQSRCDRSCEAFIATQLGYRPDMEPEARKGVWKQASTIRRTVEAGGEGLGRTDDHLAGALSASADIIRQSAMARSSWDTLRREVEKEMRRLAKRLPVYAWASGIKGFGDLSLAIIIGETGDLSRYATKERVWKRLGLAVIDGFRQQRRTNAEEAAAHGYSPKRRAEVWAIADSMFKHQWRGEKDGVTAHAVGPYGEAYAKRKAATEGREWTPKHRDNDARRVMTKQLVEDLWREWRRAASRVPTLVDLPASTPMEGTDA